MAACSEPVLGGALNCDRRGRLSQRFLAFRIDGPGARRYNAAHSVQTGWNGQNRWAGYRHRRYPVVSGIDSFLTLKEEIARFWARGRCGSVECSADIRKALMNGLPDLLWIFLASFVVIWRGRRSNLAVRPPGQSLANGVRGGVLTSCGNPVGALRFGRSSNFLSCRVGPRGFLGPALGSPPHLDRGPRPYGLIGPRA